MTLWKRWTFLVMQIRLNRMRQRHERYQAMIANLKDQLIRRGRAREVMAMGAERES